VKGKTMRAIEEQVILVTGSTDGIGKIAARELVRMGATVLMHGRSCEKCVSTVNAIRENTGTLKKNMKHEPTIRHTTAGRGKSCTESAGDSLESGRSKTSLRPYTTQVMSCAWCIGQSCLPLPEAESFKGGYRRFIRAKQEGGLYVDKELHNLNI
jgi:hypothetical protein